MSILALRMAARSNAVSRLHGVTARKTWHILWPEAKEDEVPISHITNGVHVPTWVASQMWRLYERYLGTDWLKRHDYPQPWEQVLDIPGEELWQVHLSLKRQLMRAIGERAQERWASGEVAAQQVLGMCALLDPDVLTIAFVRRFTEYKRPALILHDVQRLKRIVNDPWRPVQIVFAGKSHPADLVSKHLLERVYGMATDREFRGRIGFVEDYDMHVARYLVQGVDVWLNTPRRLNEASGTSGMKAALNGVLNLGVRDGWWHEAYNGSNGWAIGPGPELAGSAEEDRIDAEALYTLLEKEVVPMYYERDRGGVPQAWMRIVKESIRSIVPSFSARRMMTEYAERMYMPAMRATVDGKP
ncbi:MAG: alpha-glucan family phosphorylase [Chloroflexota bacterium]